MKDWTEQYHNWGKNKRLKRTVVQTKENNGRDRREHYLPNENSDTGRTSAGGGRWRIPSAHHGLLSAFFLSDDGEHPLNEKEEENAGESHKAFQYSLQVIGIARAVDWAVVLVIMDTMVVCQVPGNGLKMDWIAACYPTWRGQNTHQLLVFSQGWFWSALTPEIAIHTELNSLTSVG